jgi:hypothetical protein
MFSVQWRIVVVRICQRDLTVVVGLPSVGADHSLLACVAYEHPYSLLQAMGTDWIPTVLSE